MVAKFSKLLENRVLIKPDSVSQKTAGGIIIPDTVNQKANTGVVVQTGDGVVIKEGEHAGETIPMSVKVGDKVIYDAEDGMEIQLETGTVLMIFETSILGII